MEINIINNEVYERDYSKDSDVVNQPLKDDLFNHILPDGFFKIFGDALRAMLKYIVPEDKKAYDSLLPQLDSFAKQCYLNCHRTRRCKTIHHD